MIINKSTLDIELFEKINGQLSGFHDEISLLSKKNPDGKINIFKLAYINQIINEANILLGDKYIPIQDFSKFDEEMLPSNSDVVFILSQYLNCMEQLKVKNIIEISGGKWYWTINGERSNVRTSPPKKLK